MKLHELASGIPGPVITGANSYEVLYGANVVKGSPRTVRSTVVAADTLMDAHKQALRGRHGEEQVLNVVRV